MGSNFAAAGDPWRGCRPHQTERVLIHGPAPYSPGNYEETGWGLSPGPCVQDKEAGQGGSQTRGASTVEPNCHGDARPWGS